MEPGKLLAREGRKCCFVSSEPWPRTKQEAPIAPNFNNQGVSISPASSFCSGCERGAHPACIHACHTRRVGGVETDNEEQRMMAIISRARTVQNEVPNSVLFRTQ